MEVKRQVRYSVLLGRDHPDEDHHHRQRPPRSPEDGTLKNKVRSLKNKVRALKK